MLALGVAGTLAFYWMIWIASGARRERAVLKRHARAGRAYYAAIEAAEDDPRFSPETIEQSVRSVVALADRLWRGHDDAEVDQRPDASLIRAWARSRQLWLGRGLEVRGEKPQIDLLRVVNRPGEDEDRVDARVQVNVHCRRPRLGLMGIRNAHLDERWTLGCSDGVWIVLSIDGDPLAGPVLSAPLIPNRSFDSERLLEESLAEQAEDQTVADDAVLSQLVGADEPPALALLDLSVLDVRFLPPLIGSTLAHLVEAWEGAVSGSQAPFEALTSRDARAVLLYPGLDKRMIIRDAVLQSWEPTKLDLSRRPPAIELTLNVEAVRYAETNDGTEQTGNVIDRRQMLLAWCLELTDSARTPWRLAASNNPAEAIPGWS